MAFVVIKKVLLTMLIAAIGAALAVIGGDIRRVETIIGLLLVTLSPIISYIIVYRQIKKSLTK